MRIYLLIAALSACVYTYPFLSTITDALNNMNKRNRAALSQLMPVFAKNQPNSTKNQATPATPPTPEPNFTFKNLAGFIPEDIREIVDFMKDPEKFSRLGAHMPRGILLVGPPGTGKTSIARAIAGEIDAAFFDASATQFIELYVGTGPQRVRELFDKARDAIKDKPGKKAVIFIDELDAIGGIRRSGPGDSQEYRNTLNELLNQMDGFKTNNSIFVLGATNTPDSIDPALKRPGRFDRIVEIGLPDKNSRKDILQHYIKKIKSDPAIDIAKLVQLTQNASPADLQVICNESAVLAARANAKTVTQLHFETAIQNFMKRKRDNLPAQIHSLY